MNLMNQIGWNRIPKWHSMQFGSSHRSRQMSQFANLRNKDHPDTPHDLAMSAELNVVQPDDPNLLEQQSPCRADGAACCVASWLRSQLRLMATRVLLHMLCCHSSGQI